MNYHQANELLDDEGENQAVRSLLAQYTCDRSITIGAMLAHMNRAGWRGTAPTFALEVRPEMTLTKAGAQIWIRHLISLEPSAAPTSDSRYTELIAMSESVSVDTLRAGLRIAIKALCDIDSAGAAPTSEPATDRDATSIRDHAEFRETVESLSTQMHKPTLKRIRKDIYDTIDRRVENAVKAALAAPAAPAVPAEDDLDAVMYPPKAMLKREDWDAQTRKPKVAPAVPAAPLVASDDKQEQAYFDRWPDHPNPTTPSPSVDQAKRLVGGEVAAWQPIETAPKDGTHIMLSNGAQVSQGQYLYDAGGTTVHRDLDGRYIDQDDCDGFDGWLDFNGGMLPEPTHWMPLPEAPDRASTGPATSTDTKESA